MKKNKIEHIKSILLYSIIALTTFGVLPEYGNSNVSLDFHSSLSKQFSWVNEQRSRLIREQAIQYNISPYLIASIIEQESEGRAYLQGPLRTVKLYRKGKLVKEPHRAIGLMQIMSFYDNPRKLFNEKYNIAMGTKILNRCLQKDSTLNIALQCYNSGANSKVYNVAYINRVISSFQSISGNYKNYASLSEKNNKENNY